MNNNTDFSIQFTALRLQAKAHDVDPNTEEMRLFLMHIAEVMAQTATQEREAAFARSNLSSN